MINIVLSLLCLLSLYLLLIFFVPLSSISLRFVVLKHHPILHLLGFDVLKLLGLDDIAEVTTVTIGFQFVQEM